jgi:formamidopyrimidine-DNA glycosylase
MVFCICAHAEVFDGATSDDVVSALKGRKLLGAHRKGKQMWLMLEGDKSNILMHLGGSCS